jgi:AcrR family transcriptional regulator
VSLPNLYLYDVKIALSPISVLVKRNLYSVNIEPYIAPMKTRAESARNRVRRAPAARRTSAKRTPRAKAASEATPYHHGALHTALLEAAERILERDGLSGLTLRAVAREAGVSHAAPTHHFGDLTGLLSELAAIGFRQFNVAMTEAGNSPGTMAEKAMARAKAYVAYAQAHPGLYTLMFRTERLDMKRPALHEAADAAFAGLVGAVGAQRDEKIATQALSLDQAAAIARAWSLVHGFTMLLLDDRLSGILCHLPEGNDAATLLDAMLRTS